jgi:hypothetical protein
MDEARGHCAVFGGIGRKQQRLGPVMVGEQFFGSSMHIRSVFRCSKRNPRRVGERAFGKV